MLPEEAYLSSRPLAIPRKALAQLRESGVSGLKEATLDLGLEYIGIERVHAVCGLVTTRLARTRQALLRLSPTDGVEDQSISLLPLNHVCTFGVSLLDRTEAILDRWLPLPVIATDGTDGEDSPEADGASQRVPRSLPGGLGCRMLSVRLSPNAVLQVTFLGIQESCSAALRCLASSGVLRMLLERLHPAHLAEWPHRPALAERATRLAHQGCERLLGDSATMRLLEIVGRLVGRLLGSFAGTGCRDEESHLGRLQLLDADGSTEISDGAQLQVPADEPAVQAGSEVVALEVVSEAAREAHGERFKLVVKNSFIEVLEEPPSPLAIRRTRSVDGIAGSPGTTQVFTLVVDCVSQAGRSAPAQGGAGAAAQERSEAPQPTPAAGRPAPPTMAPPPPPPRQPPPSRPPPPQTAAPVAAPGAAAAARPAPELVPTPAMAQPGRATRTSDAAECESECGKTTVLLKGIPITYTTLSLLELLDDRGFAGTYTFVYVPVDFSRGSGLGYAVVSMESHESAASLMLAFHGLNQWGVEDNSVCSVSWNEPHQGLDALIERYRNSPVMHPSVAPAHRPAVFSEGQPVPFPAPTRTVRAPRVRHVKPTAEAQPQA